MLDPKRSLRTYSRNEYLALTDAEREKFPNQNKEFPGRTYSGLSVQEFIAQFELTEKQKRVLLRTARVWRLVLINRLAAQTLNSAAFVYGILDV